MPVILGKTEEELLARAVKQLQQNTDLSNLSPGSIARAILEIISNEMGDLYATLDFNYAQGMLDKARGTALDSLGGLLGVTRLRGSYEETTKTSCSFYFYLNTEANHIPGVPNTTVAGLSLSYITIPTATVVSTSGDTVGRKLAYETTSAITMTEGDSMAYCGIQPKTVDLLLNAGKGTLTVHSYTTVPQLRCYNPKSISAVVEYENDDDYRFRIKYELRKLAKANQYAVYMAALSVDGVRSAKIVELARGLATVDIVISPHLATGNRLNLLKRAQIAVDEVRPIGIDVRTKFPTFYTVDIVGSIVFPNTTAVGVRQNIRNQATDTLTHYLNSLGPGDSLTYNRMIGRVMDLGSSVKDFQVRSMAVNGKAVARRNYDTGRDVQLYAGGINIL